MVKLNTYLCRTLVCVNMYTMYYKAISHENQCWCAGYHHGCDAVVGTRPQAKYIRALHHDDIQCNSNTKCVIAFTQQLDKFFSSSGQFNLPQLTYSSTNGLD